MALLDYTDLQRQANITLSSPAGQTLATTIATAILSWAQSYLGFTFTQGDVTDYFDGGDCRYWLSNSKRWAFPVA